MKNEPADEQKNIIVKLSPNPADKFIRIDYAGVENAQIQLFDLNGNLKLMKRSTGNNMILNVSGYTKGIYVLRITGTNKSIIRKVIIQ